MANDGGQRNRTNKEAAGRGRGRKRPREERGWLWLYRSLSTEEGSEGRWRAVEDGGGRRVEVVGGEQGKQSEIKTYSEVSRVVRGFYFGICFLPRVCHHKSVAN